MNEIDALIAQLDVCFVIDTTSSMGPYIDEARKHARAELAKVADREGLDLRVALIEYRDHPPQESTFVTRFYSFADRDYMQAYLDNLRPWGGGDHPEAVWDGLVAAANDLDWRPQADRLAFLIGDAPPHGYDVPVSGPFWDHWPEGCPCKLTAGGIAELYASKHIRLNAYSVAGYPAATKAFTLIAEACRGRCEVAAPARVTSGTARVTGETASLMHSATDYVHTHSISSSTLGRESTPEEDARALGWSVDAVTGIKRYLDDRGIAIEWEER